MRFFSAEPDIATVFNRIQNNDIDLQPDFQRGEVWSIAKQQRLIDTILRGWVVPPILLISSKDTSTQQVLDGQQRLAAIRDFKLNKFSVDGHIEPRDERVEQLHALRYASLPNDVLKAFDRTTLRLYEIADYRPEEPAEIFFRLNQPTVLTSAERRNAFFGPVRDEIRTLVGALKLQPEVERILGFSNSRMAYDDVLARFGCTLELGTLQKKVTSVAVNEMYRRTRPLDDNVSARLESSVKLFIQTVEGIRSDGEELKPRLNKATFYSWLLFMARLNAHGDVPTLSRFFIHFERVRAGLFEDSSGEQTDGSGSLSVAVLLMSIYSDRATARVADTSSVMLRDFALWTNWFLFSSGVSAGSFDSAYVNMNNYLYIAQKAQGASQLESVTLSYMDECGWGRTI